MSKKKSNNRIDENLLEDINECLKTKTEDFINKAPWEPTPESKKDSK